MTAPPAAIDPKQHLRSTAKARLATLSSRTRREASAAIVNSLPSLLAEFPAGGHLLAFSPLPDEPQIAPLDDLAPHLHLVLPRVLPHRQLALHSLPKKAALVPGAFGILEPSPAWPHVSPSQIVAALVPGLAFDPLGTRLGRGAGYYDRLLPTLPHARRIALCFSCQLVDQLPSHPHDAAVHSILTELALLHC